MELGPETLAKAYLGAAVLFFLFLVYTAVSAEHASQDLVSGIATESPPEAHTLSVVSVSPQSSLVRGVMDGQEIDANRLDLPKCATSRRLVLDAERGSGLTIFYRGAPSRLVHPSMFEEIRENEPTDATQAGSAKAMVLYQVALPDVDGAVFPWPLIETPPNPPAAPEPPFLAFV